MGRRAAKNSDVAVLFGTRVREGCSGSAIPKTDPEACDVAEVFRDVISGRAYSRDMSTRDTAVGKVAFSLTMYVYTLACITNIYT